MADQIIINEVPGTTTPFFCLFRLYEQLLLAGWTHVESSRGVGDTPSVTDRWAGAFGSLVNDAWMVLAANSGQQILFRRGTSGSTTDGWIAWMKDGGYVAGTNQTDVLPSDTPADVAFLRGSGASPQTYTTDASWFGSTSSIATLNIGCRDASGSGDESFWLVAQSTGLSYTSTSNTAVHRIAFEALVHTPGLGIVDPNPYAWWVPEQPTFGWGEGLDSLNCLLDEDNSSGTLGRWKRWWNAGQAGEAFKTYGSGSHYQGDASNARQIGDAPNFDDSLAAASDKVIYQATPPQLIRRIKLTKAVEPSFQDNDGGYTQNIYFTTPSEVSNLDTLDGGNFAKFGNYLTVWWNGNAGTPPVEN